MPATTTSRWLLFSIVVAGAALRFYGLDWGLPYHFHTDERILAVYAERLRTADSVARLTDDAHFFLYPPLLFYPLIALVKAVSLFHPFSPAGDAAGQTLYYVLGRAIAASSGAATLVLVYLVGRRLYSTAVGLLGAVLLAFSVLHVRDSHFYFPDVPFTFFAVLVLLLAAGIAQEGRVRWYVLAGVATGAAMATKQTALMMFPVIVTAHLIATFSDTPRSWTAYRGRIVTARFWGCLVLPIAVAGVTFLLLDPFVLVNPRRFVQMQRITESFVRATSQPNWMFQFTGTTIAYWFDNLLYYGLGPWLLLVSLAGVVWAVVKRRPADLLVLAFVLPYFLFVGRGYMKFVRYAVPLLPFLCLLGARALCATWEGSTSRVARVAVGVLTTAVVVASALYAVAYVNIYRQEDVRIESARWVHEHIPQASTILIDSSAATPLIGSRFFTPEFYGRTVTEGEMYVTKQDHFTVKVLNLLTTSRTARPPDWWQGYLKERLAGVEYIVMSDEHYEQYRHRPDVYPVLDRFYRDLLSGASGYQLVKTFKTYPSLFGMTFNDDRAELTFRLFDHPRIWIFQKR